MPLSVEFDLPIYGHIRDNHEFFDAHVKGKGRAKGGRRSFGGKGAATGERELGPDGKPLKWKDKQSCAYHFFRNLREVMFEEFGFIFDYDADHINDYGSHYKKENPNFGK